MIFTKKLLFAPLFLIVFAFLIQGLKSLFGSYDFIFSLSISSMIQLVTLSTLIPASCFLFVLFASLALDWKLSLLVGAIASIIPFIFIPASSTLIFAVAIFVSFLLISLNLESALKTYLNFQPSIILGPSIRHLSTLLILAFCIIYFLSVSKTISQNGFTIPDSLIDTALKMSPINLPTEQTTTISQFSYLSADQIDMLKKNPQLLEQYGLDSKILDELNTQTKTTLPQLGQDQIKQTVKDQIQNFIKPIVSFVPLILTVLLFLTLQSLVSLFNLLIYPLLWLTFLILEKTGFIRFEVEMREVKKLVV